MFKLKTVVESRYAYRFDWKDYSVIISRIMNSDEFSIQISRIGSFSEYKTNALIIGNKSTDQVKAIAASHIENYLTKKIYQIASDLDDFDKGLLLGK